METRILRDINSGVQLCLDSLKQKVPTSCKRILVFISAFLCIASEHLLAQIPILMNIRIMQPKEYHTSPAV